jgi:hypothetical protein
MRPAAPRPPNANRAGFDPVALVTETDGGRPGNVARAVARVPL